MDAVEIRRHPDGALDVNFYRRQARELRARALRDGLVANVVRFVRAVVAVAILAATLCLVPTADGAGWNGARANPNATAGPLLPASLPGRS